MADRILNRRELNRATGLSDLRRQTDILPQRRGRVGRDRARQAIQGTGEESARRADAGLDGRLRRFDLRAQSDASLSPEQLDDGGLREERGAFVSRSTGRETVCSVVNPMFNGKLYG